MHRKIGGAEPACALAPRRAPGRGADDLQHRNVAGIERRRIALAAACREGRHGDDEGWPQPRQGVAQEGGCIAIFQARDNQRRGRKPARGKRRAQRIDRRGVGGKQQRAIEDDRDDRFAGLQCGGEAVEIDCALSGQIAGMARYASRRGAFQLSAGVAGEPPQQAAQIFAAAFAEILQQRVELISGQGRSGDKPRVVAILARQDGECDAALARQRREPFDAVFPPVEPAEQPHDDNLRVRADALDPQIDRHGMAQVAQMREPHARQRGAFGLPCGREPGEVAVGERQNRDLAGRLAEIDRFDDVVERGCGRGQEMHGRKLVLTKKRVSDRGAIETFEADHHQPPFARFIRGPGSIVLMRDPRPDGLNQQAQRLVRHRSEAFDAQHVEFFRQRCDAGGERGRIRQLLAAAPRRNRNLRGRALPRRRDAYGGWRYRPRCRCRDRARASDRPCRRRR